MTFAAMAILIGIPALLATAAGVVKLALRREFASAVRSWNLPGRAAVPTLTVGIPATELAVGLASLGAVFAGQRTAAAVSLMLLFFCLAAAQGLILRLSPRPTCGCFGRSSSPIEVRTIVRASALALMPAMALAVWR